MLLHAVGNTIRPCCHIRRQSTCQELITAGSMSITWWNVTISVKTKVGFQVNRAVWSRCIQPRKYCKQIFKGYSRLNFKGYLIVWSSLFNLTLGGGVIFNLIGWFRLDFFQLKYFKNQRIKIFYESAIFSFFYTVF